MYQGSPSETLVIPQQQSMAATPFTSRCSPIGSGMVAGVSFCGAGTTASVFAAIKSSNAVLGSVKVAGTLEAGPLAFCTGLFVGSTGICCTFLCAAGLGWAISNKCSNEASVGR